MASRGIAAAILVSLAASFTLAQDVSVRVGTTLLQRSHPGSQVLFFDLDEIPVFNAAQLEFSTAAGPDVRFDLTLPSGLTYDVRFFCLAESTAHGGLNGVLVGFDEGEDEIFADVVAAYASRLSSQEANPLFSLPLFDLLLGFRRLELHESLTVLSTDSFDATETSYEHTSNWLYGFQIGADANLFTIGVLTVNTSLRAGVFACNSHHDALFTTGETAESAHDRTWGAAFVGEWRLEANWQILPYAAIQIAYSALWIDGVALASDQTSVTDFSTGSGIDHQGNVFYQGGFVGLVFSL